MSGPQFFQTPMGKRFFEGTMPKLADALSKIAKRMEEDETSLETSEFKDPYIQLEIPDSDLSVQVKLDDEGVAVDLFNKAEPADSIVGTWKTYQEMAEGEG